MLSVLLVACAAGGEPHGPDARSGVVPSPSSRERDCRLVSKQVRAYRRHEAEFHAHPTAAGLADVAQAKITLADELDRIQATDPAMRSPLAQFAVMHREEGKSLAGRDEAALRAPCKGVREDPATAS